MSFQAESETNDGDARGFQGALVAATPATTLQCEPAVPDYLIVWQQHARRIRSD
jgi:hypothetical protein